VTRRAGIYVRISEDRTGAGLGVERQEQDCRALAERLGWQVVDVYVDNDVSAFSGKARPAYARLLADLDAGRTDAVLVWHTDRLHRSPVELEAFVSIAEKRKVTTQTVTAGELDLSTPSGRMVARILGSVARQEVEHKAERTRRAHLQAAQAGKWRGGARPFGFESDGVTIRDDEAVEVRRLTQAVIDGTSLGSLARDLNARGITSTTGKPWEFTTLRQMLLKPRNAGLSVYRGEVLGLGRWPALVPEQTWRTAVDVLKDPARLKSASNAPRWMLAGVATCGACGDTVRSGSAASNRAAGTKRSIYRCRRTGVGHVARTAEPVDQLVTEVILGRLSRPDAADLFAAGSGPDVTALEEQARGLRARLEGLAELYADGVLTDDQLATATARLRARLGDVEATVRTQRRHPVTRRLAEAGDVRKAWDGWTVTERREVVELLVNVCLQPTGRRGKVFHPESVEITWKDATA
jgi:site-specific DNA recombinase